VGGLCPFRTTGRRAGGLSHISHRLRTLHMVISRRGGARRLAKLVASWELLMCCMYVSVLCLCVVHCIVHGSGTRSVDKRRAHA
jgi:hypothetical protein